MKLYLASMTGHSESFYKIGVSSSPFNRFLFGGQKVSNSNLSDDEKLALLMKGQRYLPNCPYDVDLLQLVDFTFEGEALRVEAEILRRLSAYKYRPKRNFSGQTECVSITHECRADLINYMLLMQSRARNQIVDEEEYNLRRSMIGALHNLKGLPPSEDKIALHEKIITELGVKMIPLD